MAAPYGYYSSQRPLGPGNPFDATGFNRLKNDVEDIRDKLDRINPVEVSGGGSATATVEDDDRRSCTEAVAVNLTGGDREAGQIMYVETDTSTVDRKQLYPLPEGGIEVVYVNNDPLVTETPSIDFSAYQDDDLIVVINHYGASNSSDVSGIVTATQSEALAATYGTPEMMAESGRIGAIHCYWKNQITGGTLTFDAEGSSRIANGSSIGVVVVLRGVKRYPTDGVFLDDGSPQSVIVNGMPSFHYRWNDATSFGAATDMGLITSPNNTPRAIEYLTANSITPTTEANNLSYEFPAGTRFLVVHSVSSGSSSPTANRPDGMSPTENRMSAGGVESHSQYNTKASITAFLLPALTEPSVFSPSAVIAPFADFDTLTGYDDVSVLPIFGDPETTTFPPVTCNPLICTEYPRAAPLVGGTGAAEVRTAQQKLKEKRHRPIVIVKDGITNGQTGTVIREGFTRPWVNRLDLSHQFAGPPKENATRIDIYDAPTGSVYGKIGRFYRSRLAKEAAAASSGAIDPRVECFACLPYVLTSQREPGPFRILEWERDSLLDSTEIDVDVTATKASATDTVVTGTWDNYTLSTGTDVDLTTAFSITDNAGTNFSLYGPDFLGIDLKVDAADPDAVIFGDPLGGPYQLIISDNGLFRARLVVHRYLFIEPVLAEWLGTSIANDDPQTDTFTLAATTEVDYGFPNFAPYYYVNPETGEFGEVGTAVDYASWPEAYPTPPSLVPAGTDITNVADGFDPMIGRVPGSVTANEDEDARLGLQLAFGMFDGRWGGDSGGCC